MVGQFEEKMFDVEHALAMYAKGFVTIPAFSIYEDDVMNTLKEQLRDCHIYLIGLTPKLSLLTVWQEGNELITKLGVGLKEFDLRWQMPNNSVLRGNESDGWYIEDIAGEKYFPNQNVIAQRLASEHEANDFKVLYIGQAYGQDGSRNALDRLKKHETLQKIALKGVPDGQVLTLLMLSVEPANQLVTMFNPWASEKSTSSQRIANGLDKMFGTNEAERTTLFEASLIRYFQPQFNKDFKNSFPSTNMKLLKDCYEKDFSAVVAEIYIDELPFRIFSDFVSPRYHHIAKHDLHTDEARRIFFT